MLIEDSLFRENEGHRTVSNDNRGGKLVVTGSTFVGNVGSTVLRAEDQLEMTNTTVVGNFISGYGSIAVYAEALLTNVTVARNVTDSGAAEASAGLWVSGATGALSMANSIVADNTVSTGDPADCDGTFTSLGGNLIGAADFCVGLGPTDQSGTRAAPLDPLLGPFARGLGPTPVLPLLPGSPAIDRGNDAECPVDDQRLMPRPIDGDGDGFATCDIGAVEQD